MTATDHKTVGQASRLTPSLSVIIAHRNEPDNLVKTIASIRETAPKDSVEIIVVDDASETGFHPGKICPAHDKKRVLSDFSVKANIRLFAFPQRRGHAACRTYGAQHADGEWLLLTDAHMIFEPYWFEKFCAHIRRLEDRRDACPTSQTPEDRRDACPTSQMVFGGPYLSTRAEWEGTERKPDIFWGAMPYYWDEFPAEGIPIDILGIRPLRDPQGELECEAWTVPAVIGANYFISKRWFEHIGELPGCYGWSIDEWPLSVKTWLCGGEVRMMPDVRLRHVRCQDNRGMSQADLLANKLAVAKQTFPPSLYNGFVTAIQSMTAPDMMKTALRFVSAREAELNSWMLYLHERFVHNHEWLCDKFDLNHPADLGSVVLA